MVQQGTGNSVKKGVSSNATCPRMREAGGWRRERGSWGPPLAGARKKDPDLLNRQVHSRLTHPSISADINTCALTHIAKKLQIADCPFFLQFFTVFSSFGLPRF